MLTTIEVIWSQRDVQLLLALSACVTAGVAAGLASRGRAWVTRAAFTSACGLIVSVTLNPGFGLSPDPAGRLRQCWRGLTSAAVVREAFISPGGALNVALFVPFGVLAYVMFRRAVVTVAAAAILSMGIELTQVFLVAHDCSSVDWLSNVTGGVMGTVVGAVAVRLRRTSPTVSLADAQPEDP
ncbi:MAG TPA: VanZ family protein [Pedococcus sp.]|nr:VanZ family protein [Pedococcus sp.]